MSSDTYKLDILVGSNIGTFKHVRYDSNPKNKHAILQLQNVKDIEKGQGVTCMTWADDEQTKIILGRKNRTIQTFDVRSDSYTNTESVDFGEGNLNSIYSDEDRLIGAVSSGVVKIWKPTKPESTLIDVGGPIEKMKFCKTDSKTIATGGKENDLKVWDLETKAVIFQAKNVPHDWLQLRVPIWVSDICYLPENNGKVVGICSRYGVVRLYDARAQRRPVCSVELDNQAGSCISPGHREKHVIVGTGRGLLNLIDLRMKGSIHKSYKGAVGSVTEVTCCKERNLVISTSLDRHIRIHDAESKKIIYKQYLTSKLTCFLLRNVEAPFKANEIDDSVVKDEKDSISVNIESDKEASDSEYEDMFNKMEVIRDDDRIAKKIKNTKVNRKRKIENISVETVDNSEESKQIKPEDTAESEPVPSLDESIKRLLKNTEKQKRKLEKERKKKRSKSLFFK